MRIAEVMTQRVETVPVSDSAENALRLMRARRIRHLVVQLPEGTVGVVSIHDLDSLASDRSLCTVADVMSAPAVTCGPRTSVREAANLLRGKAISCLPVLDDGRLVGIVTTTDLLELIGRGSERPVSKGKRWVMKGRGPRRKAAAAG